MRFMRMLLSIKWQKLEAHKTSALQKRVEYPTEHGLLGRRICVIKEIAEFIDSVI